MQVAEIWRYPIKSMSGERLDHVTVGRLGVEGDRAVHVENARGRVVGPITVRLENLRARCVMTTFDPDTLEQDRGVLASIVERFEGTLALNAAVEEGGVVRVGDEVKI